MSGFVTDTRKIALIALTAAAMIGAGTKAGTAWAQSSGTQDQSATTAADTKRKEKAVTAGEVEAKRLLLLMDRDQNGKVSRQEFMTFMAEEFQRLDVNKDGELDVKELTQSRLTPHTGSHR